MRNALMWIAVYLGLALPAVADDHPVVVELYTSQGCSSCPPADKFLHELAARDDVIALALHVDYWDYIGWKDVFAQPKFTQRQHGYARAGGRRTVYTPQMIIGGTDHVVGNHPKDVIALVKRHGAAARNVDLTVTRKGGQIAIRAEARAPLTMPVVIQLVRYTPRAMVDVKRGENAGRSLSYANIVTDWRAIGDWDGQGVFETRTRAAGDAPVAVIVQDKGFGPVRAAARLR